MITDNEPKADGLLTIPLDPLPAINVSVGDLVSSRDSYLRTQLDNAIGSLIADGTIAKLMQEHGYSGTPG
jgi:polar amino acid transport system substrate-binding protein